MTNRAQARPTSPAPAGDLTGESVLAALQQVVDPELGIDIVNLGLVYRVATNPQTGAVEVDMTLTTPGCPLSGSLPAAAERALSMLPGVRSARVNLVWEPLWDPSRITPQGRARLGRR